jgi:formylglycine-generating enzyme required for sulfatase activity
MSSNKYAQLELVIHSTNTKSIGNSANFKNMAQWNDSVGGNVTTVGSNGTDSAWGTFDMAGQVYEWTETVDPNNSTNRILRGGCYMDIHPRALSKENKKTFNYKDKIDEGIFGFRVATITNTYNYSNFVLVEDHHNISDDCTAYGYGSVDYNYQISKYLVTNNEYAAFLNNIDENSDKVMELYDPRMGTNLVGGILFVSCNNAGLKYVVKPNMENKPVVFITWLNAAKYINWLNYNKNCSFDQLMDGAYDLNSQSKQRNDLSAFPDLYFLPSENEWYKAAYYDPYKPDTDGGYWKYPTRTDEDPIAVLCDDVGSGISVVGDYDSYKIFPISIITDNQESFALSKEVNSGIIPKISLSEINRVSDTQNNLFFIDTNISGLQIGSSYNYMFSAIDSNWPSNIEPISGSFIAPASGFSIRSILKFCPAYRYDSNQDCGYNLDYTLDSSDLNLIKDNIYTVLQLQLSTNGYPLVSNKISVSTSIDMTGDPGVSGLPIIKRDDCASIKIITPTGTPNSINVSGYLCAYSIPLVVSVESAKPGAEYLLSLISSDPSVDISPSSINVSFGLDGSGKAASNINLNGSERAIITAKLSNGLSNYSTQDSIVVNCLDPCR